MKHIWSDLSHLLERVLRKYHSYRISVKICVYLIVLAFMVWLIWSLPLTARVTSFGYLDEELSTSMLLMFLDDVEDGNAGIFALLPQHNSTPDISFKDRLGLGDLFINLYFSSLYFFKGFLFLIIPSLILFPIASVILFFGGLFRASWLWVILAFATPLIPIVLFFMFILDLFLLYFGFLFQSATPLYILLWIIFGLITGPLSALITTIIDSLSPAPVIGRVFTSGISGKEKWIIRGEE